MIDVLATPVAHAVGLALVHFVWQGAAIGLATACLLGLTRRGSARLRYTIAAMGLVALVAAPVATAARSLSTVPPAHHVVTAHDVTLVAGQGTEIIANSLEILRPGAANTSLATWLPGIVLAWCLGVLLMTVRLALGWLDVQRIRRHAERLIASPLRETLDRIAAELGVMKPVRFFESSLVDVPTVIGWIRPTILVPASALAGLAPSQMEAILAHELAHIRRFDYLVNGLQNLVETVLFYHPAVWWVSGEMRREREHCCDDLAVAIVGSRVTYAGALATLEESRQRALTFGMAATGGDLLARVRRVLGAPAPRRQQPSMLLAAAVLVGVGAVGLAGRTNERVPLATPPSVETAGAALIPSARATAAPEAAPSRPEPVSAIGVSPAQVTPRPTQAPTAVVPQTTWEVELRELEERFRVAKVRNDVGTLALLLDDGFSETNQNGNTRNKAQFLELFATFPIQSISQTITGVQATFERAVITGSMIEFNSSGIDAMLFTRVWVRTGTTWQLLASTQFRDPQRRVVFSPSLTEGVIVPGGAAAGGAVNVPGTAMATDAVELTTLRRDYERLLKSFEQLRSSGTIAPRSPVPTPVAPTPLGWPAIRVGGDIKEPRKIRDVRPVYPAIAKANGVSGVVIIEAVIDEAGAVRDARVLRSIPNLDQAALDAVLQWRYTPTILNGVPTAITMTVTVNFQLPAVQPAQ